MCLRMFQEEFEETYPKCGYHHPTGCDLGAKEETNQMLTFASLCFLGMEEMGPITSHCFWPHLQHHDGLYSHADFVKHFAVEKSN